MRKISLPVGSNPHFLAFAAIKSVKNISITLASPIFTFFFSRDHFPLLFLPAPFISLFLLQLPFPLFILITVFTVVKDRSLLAKIFLDYYLSFLLFSIRSDWSDEREPTNHNFLRISGMEGA